MKIKDILEDIDTLDQEYNIAKGPDRSKGSKNSTPLQQDSESVSRLKAYDRTSPAKPKTVVVAGESEENEVGTEQNEWYDDATKRMEDEINNGEPWHEVINKLAREFQTQQDGSYDAFQFAFDAFQFAFDALSKRAWEMGLYDDEPQTDEMDSEDAGECDSEEIPQVVPGEKMGWESLSGEKFEGLVLDADEDSALCEASDGEIYLVQIAKYVSEDIAQVLKRSGYLIETVTEKVTTEAGTADKAGYKSKKGGLTAKGRAHYNRRDGSKLKPPQPQGGARKRSYCARSAGISKKFNIDCRKTPKARNCLARKRWKC